MVDYIAPGAVVVAAFLTGVVGPIAAIVLTQRMRRENSDQHAEGREILNRVEAAVLRVDEKTDRQGERLAVVEDRLNIGPPVAIAAGQVTIEGEVK